MIGSQATSYKRVPVPARESLTGSDLEQKDVLDVVGIGGVVPESAIRGTERVPERTVQ
jgi:hypothetical protein